MKTNLYLVALIFATLTAATISAIPQFRASVRSYFSNDDRQILAKLSTQLVPSVPEKFTVLKIFQRDQLFIEVYKDQEFFAKIPLEEKKEAFFNFQGSATNLAVSDVDKDGTLEILVPTYNSEMIPRLNIYKYNKETNSFDRMNKD